MFEDEIDEDTLPASIVDVMQPVIEEWLMKWGFTFVTTEAKIDNYVCVIEVTTPKTDNVIATIRVGSEFEVVHSTSGGVAKEIIELGDPELERELYAIVHDAARRYLRDVARYVKVNIALLDDLAGVVGNKGAAEAAEKLRKYHDLLYGGLSPGSC